MELLRKQDLPNNIDSLKEMVIDLNKDYLLLKEKMLTLQRKFFGSRSEKLSDQEIGQMRLFNEAEDGCDIPLDKEIKKEYVIIKEFKREKKRGRKSLPDNLPKEEIIHNCEDKDCPYCGKERPVIGYDTTKELDVIPMQVKVLEHKKEKRGPCKCEAFEEKEESPIITAKMPARILPGSIASPGCLAYVATGKFVDALPFYRQETIFSRIGVHLPRATMCNWMIALSYECSELLELMWEDLLLADLIQMDETRLQVLNEPGRSARTKSYMWVTMGFFDDKRIVLFHYHQSRKKEIPLKLLKDYQGYLQTDGYEGYTEVGSLPGIIHVGCNMHARRMFYDAAKQTEKRGSAYEGLAYFAKIYKIESLLRKNKKLSNEQFEEKRKEEVLPISGKFHEWLLKKSNKVLPESRLGEAIKYSINQWPKLIQYLDKWYLTPDSGEVERAIRPFALGRKNWLFSNTPRGAHASATIYSIVESAKSNGIEPYAYMKYLFTNLPLAKTKEERLELLPHRIKVPLPPYIRPG